MISDIWQRVAHYFMQKIDLNDPPAIRNKSGKPLAENGKEVEQAKRDNPYHYDEYVFFFLSSYF